MLEIAAKWWHVGVRYQWILNLYMHCIAKMLWEMDKLQYKCQGKQYKETILFITEELPK